MRAPPALSNLPRYPVVGGTALLAIAVTIASHNGVNVQSLVLDPRLARGEVWRLVTSILPHVGPFHLIFNLYWLWVLGTLVEEMFGHVRTFALIVLLAAGSGAAEWMFLDGGVGLSGVGYGLWAMCGVLARRDPRFADAADQQTHALFVAWFFLCVVTTVTGLMPVANVAHGVGAALGGLVGLAIAARRNRAAVVGAIGAVVLAALAGATVARPWVNLSPSRGQVEAWIAYTQQTENRHEEAIGWYRQALRMREEPAWWFNLGTAFQALDRNAEALDAYARAAQLAPGAEDFRKAHVQLREYLDAVGGDDALTTPTQPTPAGTRGSP